MNTALPAMDSLPVPPRILLLEDDPAVRTLLARWIEREGGRLTVATTCAEAEALLRRQEFDLLLSDIMLPDGDGPGLVSRIEGENHGLPVIFLTGEPSVETAIRSVELRVAAYLVKPPNFDELRAIVAREVSSYRRRRRINASRRRLQEWDRELAELENLAGGSATPFTVNHLQLTLRHFGGLLNELESSVAILAADSSGRSALARVDLVASLRRTVQVLESSRRHFQSKELGDLRKELSTMLERLDAAPGTEDSAKVP